MGYSYFGYRNGKYFVPASYEEYVQNWRENYGNVPPPPITAIENVPASWKSGYLVQNALNVLPGAQMLVGAAKYAKAGYSAISGTDIRSDKIKAAMAHELAPGTPLASADPSLAQKLKELFPTLAQTGLGALAGAAITYAVTRKGSKSSKKHRKKSKVHKYRKIKKTHHKKSRKGHSHKIKPGSKAWMAKIRKMRGKKHGRHPHKSRK